jgi:hypothetical protein
MKIFQNKLWIQKEGHYSNAPKPIKREFSPDGLKEYELRYSDLKNLEGMPYP